MNTKDFPERLHELAGTFCNEVPSAADAHALVDALVGLLFPIRENVHDVSAAETARRWERLQADFHRIITPLCRHKECCCGDLTRRFFDAIPEIYTELVHDAGMYDRCDPASWCREEVILCYPGFYAVMIYRIAHVLHTFEVPILPRVVSEYAHSQTGIDIHPGATIGRMFYIDHGTGIVIGETTVIGDNVKLYQGVTLGATFVDKNLKGTRRHPTIEDNVIVYAGSTILGGDTVIGHDTIVGGNVWLTESVPPHSTVFHRPEIIIKESKKRRV